MTGNLDDGSLQNTGRRSGTGNDGDDEDDGVKSVAEKSSHLRVLPRRSPFA